MHGLLVQEADVVCHKSNMQTGTGLAERLKRHSRNNICSFYPFEPKVCRMVELCNPHKIFISSDFLAESLVIRKL